MCTAFYDGIMEWLLNKTKQKKRYGLNLFVALLLFFSLSLFFLSHALFFFSLSRRSFYNYSRKISGRLLSLLWFNLFDYPCFSLWSIVGKYFSILDVDWPIKEESLFTHTHRMTAGSVYIYLYLLSQLFFGKPTKKSPLFLRFEKKNYIGSCSSQFHFY